MSWVYFIGIVRGGPVKIGWTTKPTVRLGCLISWSPHEMRILATAPGGKYEERAVHIACDAARIRGEWFGRSRRLRAIVASVRRSGRLPPDILRSAKLLRQRHARGELVWPPRFKERSEI